jgi:hypothetical protein
MSNQMCWDPWVFVIKVETQLKEEQSSLIYSRLRSATVSTLPPSCECIFARGDTDTGKKFIISTALSSWKIDNLKPVLQEFGLHGIIEHTKRTGEIKATETF